MEANGKNMSINERVEAAIEKHGLIEKGDRVCVAVSGGPDSMALLMYLHTNREKYGMTVSAVNIEHGIRGEDSIKDSNFVKDFCAKNGIPLYSYKINVPKMAEREGLSFETAARKARYDIFDELRGKRADKVALAHHLDDNAETVLLHLFRGSGANGLKGIEYMRDGYYIRPFLDLYKKNIKEYLITEQIPSIVDKSNFDTDYDRNFIRHYIILPAAERFGHLSENIVSAAHIVREDDDFINSQLPGIEIDEDGPVKIALEHFSLHPSIVARLIFKAVRALGVTSDIEERHISLIKELAKSGKNGSALDLPHALLVTREYDCLTFISGKDNAQDADFEVPFTAGEFEFSTSVVTVEVIDRKVFEAERENFTSPPYKTLYADAAAFPAGAVFRYKREADTFKKFGGGTKKLKSYLIDLKIPLRVRSYIPLIASGGEVYTVCGREIGDDVKVTEKTQKVLRISMRKRKL